MSQVNRFGLCDLLVRIVKAKSKEEVIDIINHYDEFDNVFGFLSDQELTDLGLRKHEKTEDSDLELEAHRTMQERIEERIIGDIFVHYSVLGQEHSGMLDEVAVEGKVRFIENHDPEWGDGKDYDSPVVENPTWLQVAVLANEMIKTTGDKSHVYLEGISLTGNGDPDGDPDVTVFVFDMGS